METEFNNRRRSKPASSELFGLALSRCSGAVCRRPVPPPPRAGSAPFETFALTLISCAT